jgi:hypothetical protein
MKKILSLIIITSFCLSACQQEEGESISGSAAGTDCKQTPAFTKNIGFDPKLSAFSTSEKKVMGLAYIQFAPDGNPANQKVYQHPSWKSAGWLAPMIITPQGNVLVAPAPVINILENQPDKQNTIYVVDEQTGVMRAWLELPSEQKPTEQNPYGLLGLAYDCNNHLLFASSVMGSDRENERGSIYSIDIQTNKVIDELPNTDAMGIGVNYLNQKKRLFFGKARVSEIWSIEVDEKGKFVGKARMEVSLADLGSRGDDKARKIRFLPTGEMNVQAVSFFFNLTAPSEKQESVYRFKYEVSQAKWVLNNAPN